MKFMYILAVLVFSSKIINAIDFLGSVSDCCESLSRNCRNVCKRVSLTDLIENKIKNLYPHERRCFRKKFWRCINPVLKDLQKLEESRPCCSLSNSWTCRLSCLQAKSKSDLNQQCRKSEENQMFNCLEQKNERCCEFSKTNGCHEACKAYIINKVNPKSSGLNGEGSSLQLDHLKYNIFPGQKLKVSLQQCRKSSPFVIRCLKDYFFNQSYETYSELGCCQKSDNEICRKQCVNIFKKFTNEHEIISALSESVCGLPIPGDLLWQCFLENSKPHYVENDKLKVKKVKSSINGDRAKLYCCTKAKSSICQQLCVETHTSQWGSNSENFDRTCLFNHAENELQRCISDVEEPCTIGCSGLKFCSNFNSRDELFRSCTVYSDMSAKRDFNFWKEHKRIRVLGYDLPINDIESCHTDSWKALACSLNTKPCIADTHSNYICFLDCLKLVNDCVDKNSLPNGLSPTSLCNMLSPSEDEACISLKTYAEQVKRPEISTHASFNPCAANVCNHSQICVVSTKELKKSEKFKCVPACTLGDASKFKVPVHSYSVIPITPFKNGCDQICQCKEDGSLSRCKKLPCNTFKQCFYHRKFIEHGKKFNKGCNICLCNDGNIHCTKRKCPSDNKPPSNEINDQLSCNCPKYLSPVCGKNGKTFTNACVAKRCFGLRSDEFSHGDCFSINPCHPNNPCKGSSKRCIPKKKICIIGKSCPQYECVDTTKADYCHSISMLSPVCDTNGKQHRNICEMVKSNQELDYWSDCLDNCNRFGGLVCGMDGETYPSECSASANSVLVDYFGPCHIFGATSVDKRPLCKGVKCASEENKRENCESVIPPDACCPICGSVMRLSLDRRKLELHKNFFHDVIFISVKDLIERLRLEITTPNCKIYGHIDIHGDLIITVSVPKSSYNQHNNILCSAEASRLLKNFQNRSPSVSIDALLSSIVMAHPAGVTNISSAKIHNPSMIVIVFSSILVTISFHYLLNLTCKYT